MILGRPEFMLDCTLQAKAGFGPSGEGSTGRAKGAIPEANPPVCCYPHVKILWKTLGILVR